MILPRVDLLNHSTHAGAVIPHHNEEIINFESHSCQFINDFNMRQPLTIGAYFILALDDQHATGF
jgi:hypothetical protein